MRRNRAWSGWAMWLVFAASWAGADEPPPAVTAAPEVAPAPPEGIKEATKRFLGPSTTTYRGVLVHMDWWFKIPEQWEMASPGTLEIAFSHSPVLIERLSSMTASINDVGVSSTFLNLQNAKDGKVVWQVDPKIFKPGTMNVLNITAKMRSDLEICDDVHSPALWLSLHDATKLVMRYKERPVTLDISKFPDSYLRPEIDFDEDAKADSTHTVIVVQQAPSPAALRGIGVVSARLGATRFEKGRIEVVQVDAITPEVQARLSRYNLIAIGTTPLVEKLVAAGLDLKDVYAADATGLGHLIEAFNPWNPSRRTLVVTGSDDEALGKVVEALSLPHLAKQWESLPGQPPQRAMSFTAAPAVPASATDGARGFATLSLQDLGTTDLQQRGKFYHFFDVSFPNPFVGRVKPGAFVQLYLSHSELLVPQTSSILVRINDEPRKSIRLSPRTAGRLEAQVRIPDKYLSQRIINMKIEAFLDIGEPDCHYNYPEMAWVTLYNTSYIAYPLSEAPTTSLRSYPWVAAKEPHLGGVVLAVSKGPSDVALSTAANVAAFLAKSIPRSSVGQAPGEAAVTWLHPWLKRLDEVSAEDLKERDLILVGDYDLVRAKPEIAKSVPATLFDEAAAPKDLGAYSSSGFRSEAGWIHLAQSPWNPKRNLLVVSGAKGPPAIQSAGEYLWVQAKVDRLGGSTVMVGPNGALQVLVPAPGETPQAAPVKSLVPLEEKAVAQEESEEAEKAKAAAKTKAAEAVPEPPAAPAARHQIAYLVFAILGLMLVILVVVRIRDAMRSGPAT